MKIVMTGPKGAGKSSVAAALGRMLEIPVLETDSMVEELDAAENGTRRTCREIWRESGETTFREYECRAVDAAADRDWVIVSTGGSTLFDGENRRALRRDAILIFVTASPDVLWERVRRHGIPAYLEGDDPAAAFSERVAFVTDLLAPYADIFLDAGADTVNEVAAKLRDRIAEEVAARSMSANTFGSALRLTTFGESHGPALGAVLDGLPPGVPISEEAIQTELDRRRPGQSAVSTARKEADRVEILSGVYEGKSTGAPVGLLVRNRDMKSSHYDAIRDLFRPGHADFTFWAKYGFRDHRGGGRSSGRETAARVAGGAVARQVLASLGIRIVAHAVEIGGVRADTSDLDAIETNPVRTADPAAAEAMEKAILGAKDAKDSIGGVVQLEVHGLPAGLGDPVFGKLDARLGGALFSLGAVKGVEFGVGFAASRMKGSENNDAMASGGYKTNHAGGVLGGISSGAPLVVRLAVKPTPSIDREQETVDAEGRETSVRVEGRHDPCIVPRIVPVVESMAALVLLDCWLIQSRLRPDFPAPFRSPNTTPPITTDAAP